MPFDGCIHSKSFRGKFADNSFTFERLRGTSHIIMDGYKSVAAAVAAKKGEALVIGKVFLVANFPFGRV